MDVAPDRNGSSVTIAEAGVDTVAGNELVRGEDEVGGREAELRAAGEPGNDSAVELVGATEQ